MYLLFLLLLLQQSVLKLKQKLQLNTVVIYVVLFVDAVVIPDVDAIQSLQWTKIVDSINVVIAFKKINSVVVIKVVNHAAISKTENFVWMKIVAQAIKTIKIAAMVKII